MADKSPQAFRTIREVADWLEVEAHVLRFWESKFNQIKPVKRAGGRRYYRPSDMRLIGGIRTLLHDQGLTIRGAQKVMREEGAAHVAALSPPLDEDLQGTEQGDLVIESSALPPPVEPAPATAGFIDIDALAGDAAARGPAPLPKVGGSDPQPQTNIAASAPELDAAPPLVNPDAIAAPPTADASTETAPTPLSELRALLHGAVPFSPAQRQQLAPLVTRLEALASRLGGHGPAA